MDPRSRSEAEALLLEAGRTHGIHIKQDEVRRALVDPRHGPAFAEWASLHLGRDNLVTPDEMALYTALDKSGEVDRLAELHDLAEVQAVTDDEIRTAIQELQRSTQAITKQTDSLKLQHDALARLVKKTADTDSRRRDLETSRQRRLATERKHISAEVEDLSQSLGFRISDIEQQTGDSGEALRQIVGDVLRSDDKLLSSLQKLGWELDQQDPEETQMVAKLREVCMRLIKNTVEMLRAKLDRIYLDGLIEGERQSRGSSSDEYVTEDEVNALQAEVESLYSEILPVAQMSVEQRYIEPALKSVSSRSSQGLSRSVTAIAYINGCLDHLLERTGRLADRIGSFKSHQAASTSLVATAKAEIATPTEPPSRPAKPVVPASPVRRRPRAATAPRHSSSLIDVPPTEALLQLLSVHIDIDADNDGGEQKIQALSRALADRISKESDVAQSSQESFERSVTAYLDDARRALQLLRDSLLAESAYGEVKLADPEVDGSIALLSREVVQLRNDVHRAEVHLANGGKSEKREEILQRWGQ
ncbi:hypothetical protein GMORB2_4885 [Geosmithia morbida]|uniref:Uncharacterized protein n=1 Tax=Geosmithia morbida TaxID=1094350 RepID=A0A9P4YPR4_9HYPO|nr:uncharacterized protein GMORB2_4885 [Geosmithia morbida]KAF4119366.1 hypothetical protein GMORB2_4885 [Geosmithia morbida]